MAAVCEAELISGAECGVVAVGRCNACGKAMCTSHRYVDGLGAAAVDRCAVCGIHAGQRTSTGKPMGTAAEVAWIARALAAAGSPEIQPRSREVSEVRRSVFGNLKKVRRVESLPPGWSVGVHTWRHSHHDQDSGPGHFNTFHTDCRTWVLGDGTCVPDAAMGLNAQVHTHCAYHDVAQALKAIAERNGVAVPAFQLPDSPPQPNTDEERKAAREAQAQKDLETLRRKRDDIRGGGH
jgi:hypothetical protein